MKILYCHNTYQVRSGEDVAADADVGLMRSHGLEVVKYWRSNDEIKEFNWHEKARLPADLIFSSRTFREVRALVRDERPDLALVQNVYPLISPSVYYALRSEGVPIVQLVYNYRLMCANGCFYTQGRTCRACVDGTFLNSVRFRCYRDSRLLSGLYGLSISLHRWLGLRKRISAFVSPARFLVDNLAQVGYPRERMHLMYNPFDSTAFREAEAHEGFFLFVGRITREKGIFTLLKAAVCDPGLRITIVGRGEAESEMVRFIQERHLSSVTFLGPRYGDELDEVMQRAAAVVTPVEWFEVSPLVVYQAFASSKPVISSRIQSMPELVRDGENGLLFETGNAQELAEKMRLLLSDEALRIRLGRNARQLAAEQLTGEMRFQNLSRVFSTVLKQ